VSLFTPRPRLLLLPFGGRIISLDFANALSLWPFRALLDLEFDDIVFGEALIPRAFNGAVMDKNVLTAIIRGDKTKSLRITEPLHSTFTHVEPFL